MVLIIIIGVVIVIGLIVYFLTGRNAKPSPKGGYFISTEGQSEQRIMKLNLDKASEDASHILDKEKLSFPKNKRETEKREYKADSDINWIINLRLSRGGMFKKQDLLKMLDYSWRTGYDSEVYGYSPEEERWTFAFAGNTPEVYSEIQLAISLLGVYNSDNPDYAPEKLENYITELTKRIKTYPSQLEIEPTETIAQAIEKAKMLVAIHHEFNRDAIVVLNGARPFDGRTAWDALLCVGLKWGDGDLFHWNNYGVDYGHDQHFSVWTTTAPGYFLPEEVIAGRMNPADLVFGFSIPRSADPVNIFDAMMNAARYARKRLNGVLLDRNGQLFNEALERENIVKLVESMKAKGIIPGSYKVLCRF